MVSHCSFSLRPNRPPRDVLEAYLEQCCQTIRRHYPKRRTFPDVRPYAITILHEAAHALMAFEHGVRVNYIAIKPMRSGGGTDIFTVVTGKGLVHDSEIEAKIWIAGYCASWLFWTVADEPEYLSRHDLWQALMCLERGEWAAHELRRWYGEQLGGQRVQSSAQVDAAMRAAGGKLLQHAPPDYVKKLRTTGEAKTALRDLVLEICKWIICRMPVLRYLLDEIARRNRFSEGIDAEPALFEKAFKRVDKKQW